MAKENEAVLELREKTRKEIESQVEAFLAQGGRVEQVPILKNRHGDMGKASDNSQASVLETW